MDHEIPALGLKPIIDAEIETFLCSLCFWKADVTAQTIFPKLNSFQTFLPLLTPIFSVLVV